MKFRRSDVRRALPAIRSENHAFTSFAGLVLFPQLLATLPPKQRLRGCLRRLAREPRMTAASQARRTTVTRAALRAFQKLDTLRAPLIHRAGRFTRPPGRLQPHSQRQFLGPPNAPHHPEGTTGHATRRMKRSVLCHVGLDRVIDAIRGMPQNPSDRLRHWELVKPPQLTEFLQCSRRIV